MMSKMDEVYKNVLNDGDIFFRKRIVFNHKEWENLKKLFKDGKMEEYTGKIDEKILESQDNEVIEFCENLKKSIKGKRNILDQMFNFLDEFAIIKSNLPDRSSMDNFGTVIERYNQSIVEEYFLDKIKKEYNPKYNNYSYRGKALIKVLEYVQELYNSNVPSEEIAYFFRKLNSLENYWRTIK
ncbi:MAG: hypothetical protein ACTSX0_13340 [Promethearchaeota archaeon]